MKSVKFTAAYTHQIDERFRKTWPAGWPFDAPAGQVDDDVALGARRAEAAIFVGEGAEENEASFRRLLKDERKAAKKGGDNVSVPKVQIPDDWREFKEPDLIDLAVALGAGSDVRTGAAATAFIEKIAAQHGLPLL